MDSINYSSAREDICDTIRKFLGNLILSRKQELFSLCKGRTQGHTASDKTSFGHLLEPSDMIEMD